MTKNPKYYRMYLLNRRLKLNLSINKICNLTNSSRQHYYRVERGQSTTKLTFIYMCKIARALGFTLDEMFAEEYRYLSEMKLLKESGDELESWNQ